MTFRKSLSVLCLLYIQLQITVAEVQFKNCEAPADLGGLDKRGFYFNTCVRREHFANRTHAWDFRKAVVKQSSFTSCGFQDTIQYKLKFEESTWQDVTFKNCEFGSSRGKKKNVIKFERASFQNVLFDGCSFHSSSDVVFSEFAFDAVTFKNCKFRNQMNFTLGRVTRSVVTGSSLGSLATSATSREGDMLFSKMTINRLAVNDSHGNANIRIQEASVAQLEITSSTLGSLACHEPIPGRTKMLKTASMNDTFLHDVSFTDGMFCGYGVLRGLEMQNIKVENIMDLREATIEGLAIMNLTSLSNSTCSDFSLEGATVSGARLTAVNTTKGSLQGALFAKGFLLERAKISTTFLNLKDTIFSQEKINEECCTVACLEKGCKCDVSVEPVTGCPRGNSSLNVNIVDSCFPSDSMVSVLDASGNSKEVEIRNLIHGSRVINVHGGDISDVFFFGHRTESQNAAFKRITTQAITGQYSERVLRISRGHLVPVADRGDIPARKVAVGDLLFTSNGGLARVIHIRTELRKGMYAPTTLTGRLSVDGIQVSCYTETLPRVVAHVSLAPLRALYRSSRRGRAMLERFSIFHERSGGWIVDMLRNVARDYGFAESGMRGSA